MREDGRERVEGPGDPWRRPGSLAPVEVETAREVQRALTPAGPTLMDGRVRVHLRVRPGQRVGGSFLSLVPSGTDETTLAMFDVAGHGVRAVLIASHLRALLLELPFSSHDPAELLATIDARLRRTFHAEPVLARALCVVLRPAAGSLRFASAAHPLPFRLSPVEQELTSLAGPVGPPLGLMEDARWETGAAAIEDGERLLLFSEAALDAPLPGGGTLGRKGLEALARAHLRAPAESALDRVLEDLAAHGAPTALEDDLCLALAEVV